MSLGALAMEVFSEQTNSNPILVNFARSAAGFGLVAGACMPPAHASTCQHMPAATCNPNRRNLLERALYWQTH